MQVVALQEQHKGANDAVRQTQEMVARLQSLYTAEHRTSKCASDLLAAPFAVPLLHALCSECRAPAKRSDMSARAPTARGMPHLWSVLDLQSVGQGPVRLCVFWEATWLCPAPSSPC